MPVHMPARRSLLHTAQTKMAKAPVRVAITGAAGQIGYSLMYVHSYAFTRNVTHVHALASLLHTMSW